MREIGSDLITQTYNSLTNAQNQNRGAVLAKPFPCLMSQRVTQALECLDRMILFGETSLRQALREYVAHYHAERNHQGIGNQLVQPVAMVSSTDEPIQCRERLGGMLNFYYREAAFNRVRLVIHTNAQRMMPLSGSVTPLHKVRRTSFTWTCAPKNDRGSIKVVWAEK